MRCWGDGSSGQFGRSARQSVFSPSAGPISVKTRQISCGEQHTLFLLEDGNVLSCGQNSKGQLGRQKDQDSKSPGRVEGLGGVVSVVCGRDHSVAVLSSGSVLSWGAGGAGQLGIDTSAPPSAPRPRPVPFPDRIQVVQVACGDAHSLALTSGGDVYSWGLNSHGQLGLGKGVSLQPYPTQVRSLTGVPVTQVAAGGTHTLVLSLSGLVYCCGANRAGQLGLNRVDDKGRFNVCEVPALRSLGISFISCGDAHTAVLTKNGQVFSFGEGSRGQLGHNSTANEQSPRLVEGLGGVASQITCGSHHTLVLESSGHLWAFGSGVKGQLGTGSPQNSLQPMEVQLPRVPGELTTPTTGMTITAGWNSSFVYTAATRGSGPKCTHGRLDEDKLQQWRSMQTGNKQAQGEISLMFSTSASLVASFTKLNQSKSGMTLTVDTDAANQVLDLLLNTPWAKQSVDLTQLLGDLLLSSPVLKSPEVFLLLPLCPPLHQDQSVLSLVMPLAVALSRLNHTAMQTLKDWLAKMSASVLTKHIQLWKHTLGFLLRCGLLNTHNPEVRLVLLALKHLYRANKRAAKSQRIPISFFYVDEIASHVHLPTDVMLWHSCSTAEDDDEEVIFCCYPFLMNLQCKIYIFNYHAEIGRATHHFIYQMSVNVANLPESAPAPVFQLKLRRPCLVEDTFRQLAAADHCAFSRELLVQFVDDMTITQVNKRDFFLHIFKLLLESEMFVYNDRQTLLWFPSQPTERDKNYFLFGVLCGMALYNHNIVHLPFPLVLFKKLVNVRPSLDDMIEFESIVGGSLRYILLDYTDDDLENLDMTYSVHWGNRKVELDPNQPGKLVTSSNKREFVDAYVNYAFNQSVERVFEEFKRGFFKVCVRKVVDLFQPAELQGVMVGKEDYDWPVLRESCVYEGEFHTSHPSIVAFWEVFEELTAEQKKAFLLFLTGCDRVPILGMKMIIMRVSPLLNANEHHFPESLTCHFLLLLPIYPSNQILKARLIEALNHNRGFWKE
ncbi:probable E3 ubiquitin-protein ligase HERC6 isoform X3 [Hypomesus transpacificus]|uniref:probable E3 ubiquitin-protein ligase HERC6 isoform X3 n=1 Tax=Hypomesus transpacificus TaxID=137520 RepID=UPI001F07B69F|nr:probable E3 ubiquitin-protein ligase HERC6 isoform X3 [Hypomesus transpacificus]